ncbi:hypothetical protein AAF712_014026 [Marasmius tenuissimus]|uniref:Uncharacterized protein n=1 Tax=Marasmius tenuissimus TaxID=585030 RepID=A0ABR2ZD68_9AGAR
MPVSSTNALSRRSWTLAPPNHNMPTVSSLSLSFISTPSTPTNTPLPNLTLIISTQTLTWGSLPTTSDKKTDVLSATIELDEDTRRNGRHTVLCSVRYGARRLFCSEAAVLVVFLRDKALNGLIVGSPDGYLGVSRVGSLVEEIREQQTSRQGELDPEDEGAPQVDKMSTKRDIGTPNKQTLHLGLARSTDQCLGISISTLSGNAKRSESLTGRSGSIPYGVRHKAEHCGNAAGGSKVHLLCAQILVFWVPIDKCVTLLSEARETAEVALGKRGKDDGMAATDMEVAIGSLSVFDSFNTVATSSPRPTSISTLDPSIMTNCRRGDD